MQTVPHMTPQHFTLPSPHLLQAHPAPFQLQLSLAPSHHHWICIHLLTTSCKCNRVSLHFQSTRCNYLSLQSCCGTTLFHPHHHIFRRTSSPKSFNTWHLYPTYSLFQWKCCFHSFTKVPALANYIAGARVFNSAECVALIKEEMKKKQEKEKETERRKETAMRRREAATKRTEAATRRTEPEEGLSSGYWGRYKFDVRGPFYGRNTA